MGARRWRRVAKNRPSDSQPPASSASANRRRLLSALLVFFAGCGVARRQGVCSPPVRLVQQAGAGGSTHASYGGPHCTCSRSGGSGSMPNAQSRMATSPTSQGSWSHVRPCSVHEGAIAQAREAFGGDGEAKEVPKQFLASLARKSPEVHAGFRGKPVGLDSPCAHGSAGKHGLVGNNRWSCSVAARARARVEPGNVATPLRRRHRSRLGMYGGSSP
jgi:hypothetical protein